MLAFYLPIIFSLAILDVLQANMSAKTLNVPSKPTAAFME
ncbi:hypothetical protein ACVJGD_007728 [Bradyrhizobium sp. USDA 10063]